MARRNHRWLDMFKKKYTGLAGLNIANASFLLDRRKWLLPVKSFGVKYYSIFICI